jgi:hypothetical protein
VTSSPLEDTMLAAKSMTPPRTTSHLAVTRAVVAANGVFFALTGLALLLTPAWFYATIGTFPPYNRHYAGDLGAFLLPLGVGLLLATRSPARHRLLIAVAAAGGLLHAFNHAYDALLLQAPLSYWLVDTAPLLVSALLLCWAAWRGAAPR